MAELKQVYLTKTAGTPLRRDLVNARLLHAVGGVDYSGRALTVSRADACPRLASLGLGWTPSEKDPELQTDMLFTGSSVPTAVVAGVAAAMAAQQEVLEAHPGSLVGQIQMTSMKKAQFQSQLECDVPAWTCKDVPWVGAPTAGAPEQQNPHTDFPWSEELQWNQDPLHTLPTSWPGIRGQVDCEDGAICGGKLASASVEIHPQPEIIPCGRGCVLQSPADVEGDPEFYIEPTTDLTEATLRIDGVSEKAIVYDLTLSSAIPGKVGEVLNGGHYYRIRLDKSVLPAGDLLNGRATFSALSVTTGKALSEQVLIVE